MQVVSDRLALRVPNIKPSLPRPTTLAEAKQDVSDTYQMNKWDADAQLRFHEICRVEVRPLYELGKDEVRAILTRMESSGMIIYKKEPLEEKRK
mgnify:CR=1 FL=1